MRYNFEQTSQDAGTGTIPVPQDLSKGLFVAVGHDGCRIVSADGTTWINQQLGKEGEIYRQVSFGNGHFATVGSYGGDNIVSGTRDGATWVSSKKDARYANYIRGLGFGNNLFMGLGGDPGAVGDSRPFISTSADGETWADPYNVAGKNMLRRIAWGGDRFVAVGDRGRRATSKDGKEWTDTPDVKAIDTLIDVGFGAGRFVGVGLHGLRMCTADGVTWTDRQTGEEGQHLNSILWTGDRFVAVGMGATYFSPDGVKWDRKDNSDAPLVATFGNNLFVGTNWRGRVMTSADAIAWKLVFKCDHHLEAVAFGRTL